MSHDVTKRNKSSSLDNILVQLGDLGTYQLGVISLLCLVIIIHSMTHIAFVFTAKNPGYRCNVPCNESVSNDFNPPWLTNVVPYIGNKPASCWQFQPYNTTNYGECGPGDFNRDLFTRCQNGYVYDTDKISIVNDFDIHCEENTWLLTMVGTVNNLGLFVGLPLAGLFSDRYGRRMLLVSGMITCGICGILRAMSRDYITFLIFEFLDAAFSAGTYSCAVIVGIELVGPSKRVLSGIIISTSGAIGGVGISLLSWWITSWRTLCFVLYIPALLIITYLWLTPESVRWLLSQGRYEEAKQILRRVSVINKKPITNDALDKLTTEEDILRDSLVKLIKSPILRLRFISCCFCWITCAFLFYGITLNSVSLAAGNSYVDFILTSLVEIPAYIASCIAINKIGRRKSQCYSFLLTGISSLLFAVASEDNYQLQLFVSLFGKFGATAAFTIIYIITTEVFPTPMRHSMMGACSMVGRIGSMTAPQMPLLAQIWKPLPLLLFGILSSIAGFLSLLFPETLNTKLPDTIEEAENINIEINNSEKIC